MPIYDAPYNPDQPKVAIHLKECHRCAPLKWEAQKERYSYPYWCDSCNKWVVFKLKPLKRERRNGDVRL